MTARRWSALAATVAGVVLAVVGCGGGAEVPQRNPQTAPGPMTSAAPPVAPEAAAEGPCPYLDESAVEGINGQQAAAVRVSLDEPYPACFFFRPDGSEQLRTWVVQTSPGAAVAVVDAVAPVDTSDPAELPGGWSGGSQPTGPGAVYAVAKDGTAVVVTTNQAQTFKARLVAEQVIENLDL